jgi:hypothetical protein
VVYQRLHLLNEPGRAGQFGVNLECRFIRPARVDVEQPRIANGAIGLDGEAAWLLAHALGLFAQHRRRGLFITFAGVKAGEDE